MQQSEIDIEALKTNTEFLKNLELLEDEMRQEESIAKGYQLLDAKLLLESEEDEINELFTFIVNKAFDTLADYLAKNKGFDMTKAEELATARAIYENGIQRYSENEIKGAKEIFLILHHTIQDQELKDSMMIHACAVMAGHSFEEFIQNIADTKGYDEMDPTAFFIKNFTQPNDILLEKFAKYVKLGKEELNSLSNA